LHVPEPARLCIRTAKRLGKEFFGKTREFIASSFVLTHLIESLVSGSVAPLQNGEPLQECAATRRGRIARQGGSFADTHAAVLEHDRF